MNDGLKKVVLSITFSNLSNQKDAFIQKDLN